MPSPAYLAKQSLEAVRRNEEFFQTYRPANEDDQPWVDAQLAVVRAELARRESPPDTLDLPFP